MFRHFTRPEALPFRTLLTRTRPECVVLPSELPGAGDEKLFL